MQATVMKFSPVVLFHHKKMSSQLLKFSKYLYQLIYNEHMRAQNMFETMSFSQNIEDRKRNIIHNEIVGNRAN